MATQYHPSGRTTRALAADIEGAVRDGRLLPGHQLPPVRVLAATVGVAPGTVAAAYRQLRDRGLLTTGGRRGTVVAGRPPLPVGWRPPVPRGARDLASGNPDPAQLPDLGPVLAGLDPGHRLYGEAARHEPLVRLARRRFDADGIPAGPVAVVGGALDGVERVLGAHLRPGDRVGVEDPGFTGVLDLVTALGLVPVPVAVDDEGMVPDHLDRALRSGLHALVVTPRAQNPTGAAHSPARARDLTRLLALHPGVVVVEDDHAGPVAGAAHHTVAGASPRWAVIRSYAKSLGPDLRVAVLTGDETTVARVEGRQALGTGWVSHLLQRVVARLLAEPATGRRLRRAGEVYAERRAALVGALAARGVPATGRSGLNVWVPVPGEEVVVRGLLAAGWAVAAGEGYRRATPPGVRVTVATLAAPEADGFAAALAAALRPAGRTRRG